MTPSILLVDSYDHSRRALAELLREDGYSVVEARNGMEGLRVARDRRPDLIIMDLWPFFRASVQMMERVRRDGPATRVPVLVVTSAVSPEYRSRAFAAGCAGYLEKPCAPARVLAEIRGILSAPPPGEVPSVRQCAAPAWPHPAARG